MARRERRNRVPVALPAETHPAAWLRNFRLSGFALTILILVVAAMLVLAAPLKTLVEQRQQIAQLQASKDAAQAAVDKLKSEVNRWNDPAYIESQARERLYYVFPGDVSYFVVNGPTGDTTSDGQPISDKIQSTKVDWVSSLLSTYYQAGLTTATPAQLDSPQQSTTP
ncbi:MAG TPA: septum formation initiator family protein [Pseudolysinimonas sp.]|nr:septum formation initiator family protein [Pseudolysinimonas sp.]